MDKPPTLDYRVKPSAKGTNRRERSYKAFMVFLLVGITGTIVDMVGAKLGEIGAPPVFGELIVCSAVAVIVLGVFVIYRKPPTRQ